MDIGYEYDNDNHNDNNNNNNNIYNNNDNKKKKNPPESEVIRKRLSTVSLGKRDAFSPCASQEEMFTFGSPRNINYISKPYDNQNDSNHTFQRAAKRNNTQETPVGIRDAHFNFSNAPQVPIATMPVPPPFSQSQSQTYQHSFSLFMAICYQCVKQGGQCGGGRGGGGGGGGIQRNTKERPSNNRPWGPYQAAWLTILY